MIRRSSISTPFLSTSNCIKVPTAAAVSTSSFFPSTSSSSSSSSSSSCVFLNTTTTTRSYCSPSSIQFAPSSSSSSSSRRSPTLVSSSSSSSSSKTATTTKKNKKNTSVSTEIEEPEPVLNSDQQKVLKHILQNPKSSVFLTGGAGTGKSVLIRAIAKSLPSEYTYLTAPTGVAALNINGITLHSFLRLQPDGQFDIRSMITGPVFADIQRRLWTCRTLIIDEISMVEPSIFQLVDRLAQITRKCHEPFGGMQVILCGDFLQLPPVSSCGTEHERMVARAEDDEDDVGDVAGDDSSSNNNNKNSNNNNKGGPKKFIPYNKCNADTTSKYAFQTREWQRLNPKLFQLNQVMRQKEPELINLLNNVRVGKQTEAQMKKLLMAPDETTIEADVADDNAPVRIFCRNKEVNARNRECFTVLKKSKNLIMQHYDAKYATSDIDPRREMVYYCAMHGHARVFGKVIPKTLRLCVGARVMLLRNLDVGGGLVNGSTGIVVGFRDQSDKGSDNCDESASYYSSSIASVAAAAAGGGDQQKLSKPSSSATFGDDVVAEEFTMKCRDNPYESLRPLTECWPVVKFHGVKEPVVIRPAVWKQKSGGAIASQLMQVPLRLAYAKSAHKAQGVTLRRVQVDLSSAFEFGQGYVALSRAQSIEGLRIVNYNSDLIKPCPIALDFHKKVDEESVLRRASSDSSSSSSSSKTTATTAADKKGPKKKKVMIK